MRPWDQECLGRIARHRLLRRDKGFETVERYTDLAGLALPAEANVLLECMSNLTANELYDPEGGTAYGECTLRYLRALARINRALAARADTVVETVCGLPNYLKGGPIL